MLGKKTRNREDFHDEIEAHIQIEADRLAAEGMSRGEALAAARRAFGNVTQTRERFYESSRWMWLDHLTRDIRYAWRQMKSSPLSTATVILSLALGIGVNTAIFSLADQALWRALPVHHPEELVQLDWNGRFIGGGNGWGSLLPYLFYRDLRAGNDVFVDMFARSPADVSVSAGEVSEAVTVDIVTGSYFSTLGVRAALGRLIGDSDDVDPDAHPVVVLSYDYWRTRFGADPAIVGKQIQMNAYPLSVIGVAEQGFHGTDWSVVPSIWIPAMMKPRATIGQDSLFDRRTRFLHVFGRLKPGISREQAEARLEPWFRAYLEADTQREGWPQVTGQQMREYRASHLDVLPGAQGQSRMGDRMQQPMLVLLAATALILLLACLNVANLSLARTLARRRATALRAALGASRRRILAEQFTESALLAAVGCAAGVLLAPPVSRAILSFLPRQGAAGMALNAGIDVRVLLFALSVAVLTTLLSGLAPAFYAAAVRPVTALKQQSSAVAGGLGLRKALVVGQFALALILLVGAGLFTRTLATLRAQGPGFPTTNLMTFRLTQLGYGMGNYDSKLLSRRLLAAVEALPEVERAAVVTRDILTGGSWNNPVTIEFGERITTDQSIPMNAVTPEFFETLGVTVTRGRNFDSRDSRDDPQFDPRSAIVNDEFVRQYLHGAEPLGARIGIGNRPDTVAGAEIVGVVTTFQDRGLREREPQVFFPLWELPSGAGVFYLRTRTASQAAAASIRAAVRGIDPALTITSMRTIDDQLDRMLTTERMLAALAEAFAVIATLLAMIGLYGVLSFSAARRTKEIGIRLALGAPRWSAVGLIVREAALLAAAGLAIALPASWALGRFIESQLFGVRPMDAATIAGAAAVLAVVCLLASALPARKAGAVNPLDALRTE
jgi:predicted permease